MKSTSLQGQLEFSAWISLHAERTRKTSKRNEWNEWKNQICLWFCTAICIAAARQRLSFESKALLLKAFELFKTKPSKNMRCSQALVPLQLAPYNGWLRRDFRWVFGFFVEVKICTVRLGLAPRDHPEALQKRILLQWCQRPLTRESTYIFQFFSDVKVTLAEALKLLVKFCIVFEGSKEERGNGYWWIILKCESSKLPPKKIHLSLILLNSKRQKSWLRSSQPAMCSITVDQMIKCEPWTCGNSHELFIDQDAGRVHELWAPVSIMEFSQIHRIIIKSDAPLAHHPVSDMQPSKVHNDSLAIETVEGMLKCKCRTTRPCTKQWLKWLTIKAIICNHKVLMVLRLQWALRRRSWPPERPWQHAKGRWSNEKTEKHG